MKIRTHLGLMIVAEFGVFFLIAVAGIGFFVAGESVVESNAARAAIIGGSLLVAVLIVRFLFRHLIGAECPNRCGGVVRPRGKSPIVYVCDGCDFRHETGVSEQVSASDEYRR